MNLWPVGERCVEAAQAKKDDRLRYAFGHQV
jgi:hypothetical protein